MLQPANSFHLDWCLDVRHDLFVMLASLDKHFRLRYIYAITVMAIGEENAVCWGVKRDASLQLAA